MGLIVDTNVFISCERRNAPIDLSHWEASEQVFISVITVSELLMGVYRANTMPRRNRRSTFVEALITRLAVLDFTTAIAHIHAEIGAHLGRSGKPIGAHDLIIAATARYYDYSLLTDNVEEFTRVPGLRVVEFAS